MNKAASGSLWQAARGTVIRLGLRAPLPKERGGTDQNSIEADALKVRGPP